MDVVELNLTGKSPGEYLIVPDPYKPGEYLIQRAPKSRKVEK